MPRGDKVQIIPGDDGFCQLRGMRVFSTVGKGENGNKDAVTREWLDQAVARAQQRLVRDGYAAPVHVNHTSSGRKIGCGTFVPVGVEDIEYDGKARPTIVVNARVPDWCAEKVRRGEMPFRSVEIPSDGSADLASLALMDDTVPFFRYGNLCGEVLEAAAPSTMTVSSFAAAASPMLAFADVGKKRASLFESKGEEYEDGEADDDEVEVEGDDAEGAKPAAAAPVEPGAPAAPGAPAEQQDAAGGAGGLAKKIDALLAWIQRIGEKVLGEKPAANAPQNPVEPGEMADKSGGVEMSKTAAAVAAAAAVATIPTEFQQKLAEVDDLKTRLKALEDKGTAEFASRTAATEAGTRLAAAKTKLVGRNLSTKDDADLAEFAAMGQKPLDMAVAIIERRPLDDGGSIDEAFRAGAAEGTGTGEPAEVAEYSAKGPAQYAKAKELARGFAALQRVGLGCTLKEFLATEMSPRPLVVDVRRPS